MKPLRDAYRPSQPGRDIATKAELDQLSRNRATPEPHLHLRPDEAITSQVNEQVMNSNERRITDLEQRLQRMREGGERDFTLAAVHGRAKSDFDRSRE